MKLPNIAIGADEYLAIVVPLLRYTGDSGSYLDKCLERLSSTIPQRGHPFLADTPSLLILGYRIQWQDDLAISSAECGFKEAQILQSRELLSPHNRRGSN
jgi:hypothetical protein